MATRGKSEEIPPPLKRGPGYCDQEDTVVMIVFGLKFPSMILYHRPASYIRKKS